MMKDFWDWFNIKRAGLSVREVERRGDAPRGRISNVYYRKEPSALVCDTIAKGLDVDPAEVYRRAGLLPPPEEEKGLPSLEEMIKDLWIAYKAGELGDQAGRVTEEKVVYDLAAWQEEIDDPILQKFLRLWNQLSVASQVEVLNFARFRLSQEMGSTIEEANSSELKNFLTHLVEKAVLQQSESDTREKFRIESNEEHPEANMAEDT